MNKKFLKSVAILGLATTALGTAQPVGAIVGNDYSKEYETIYANLKRYKQDKYLVGGHFVTKSNQIEKLFSLIGYLLNKDEFSEKEYEQSIKKLRASYFSHSQYLERITIRYNYTSDLFRQKIANLTFKECDEFIKSLDKAIKIFADEISQVQRKNLDLISVALYSKPIEMKKYRSTYKDGFSEDFYYDYMYYSDRDLLLNHEQININFFKKLKEVIDLYNSLKKEINNTDTDEIFNERLKLIINENPILSKLTRYGVNGSDEVEEIAKRNVLKGVIVFSEEIPNIRIANIKLEALKDLRDELGKSRHKSRVESRTQLNSPSNLEKFDDKMTDEEIAQLPDSNKDVRSGYVILDERYDEYYDNDGLMKSEFKKIKDSYIKEKREKVVFVPKKSDYSSQNLSSQITLQTPAMPIYQARKVEVSSNGSSTLLISKNNQEEPSALHGYSSTTSSGMISGFNTNSLPDISGEKQLPYTQLIGGSNVKLLAGSEGERSDLEIRSIDKKDDKGAVLAGKNNKPLPGLSGERNEVVTKSEKIDVNYNVNSTSKDQAIKANKDDEKISNTPSKQVATQAVTTETKAIDNKFDTYYKNEADRIMTEYTEMRNSLHFYDWDATVADLTQKGNATFKELEDALSNSKTASQQELINATDRLNVLRTNLERRKEELGRQELNKLQDAISNYNTAYNTLYSKVHNLDEQHYAEYDEASGSGRAITQYFDRLLSEGKLDYSNIFASESVKTELSRLEGFTTTLTKLAQTINQ